MPQTDGSVRNGFLAPPDGQASSLSGSPSPKTSGKPSPSVSICSESVPMQAPRCWSCAESAGTPQNESVEAPSGSSSEMSLMFVFSE